MMKWCDVYAGELGLPELENLVFYRGADREGHPVCYNVYDKFQDKDLYGKAFSDEEKRERFLKWCIQLLKRDILSKLDFAASGICSMVQVTDLKNSLPMFGKHHAVTRQAVAMLQDNYPEFVAKKVEEGERSRGREEQEHTGIVLAQLSFSCCLCLPYIHKTWRPKGLYRYGLLLLQGKVSHYSNLSFLLLLFSCCHAATCLELIYSYLP